MTRQNVEFSSEGVLCRAWLFRPRNAADERLPAIVMAHGFGATRDASLEPYATRFAEDGFLVLVFDYRHFGASDGRPRQLLDVERQLKDWQAAVDFVRSRDDVDPKRVGLWGSSFSGGHVVVAAVRDGNVAAVSAQCPMMDGLMASLEALRYKGLWQSLRMAGHGLLDVAMSAVGTGPHTIPIVAAPGNVAVMSTEDADRGYHALMPADFRNEVAARIGLTLGGYRPGRHADELPCPILIQICLKDSVAPPEAAEATARRAGDRAEVKRYAVGHFDIYQGSAFEQSVSDQREFFSRHLSS